MTPNYVKYRVTIQLLDESGMVKAIQEITLTKDLVEAMGDKPHKKLAKEMEKPFSLLEEP